MIEISLNHPTRNFEYSYEVTASELDSSYNTFAKSDSYLVLSRLPKEPRVLERGFYATVERRPFCDW